MKMIFSRSLLLLGFFYLIGSSTVIADSASLLSFYAYQEGFQKKLPGYLVEKNDYNSAGQKISDAVLGSDGSVRWLHDYDYCQGELSKISDPRGFTTLISYDAWQRPIKRASRNATLPEQNQTTRYSYDPRGLLTSVAQCYENSSSRASTVVTRDYDAYGQLVSEITDLDGIAVSAWRQAWNEVGRRVRLTWTLDEEGKGADYQFQYNALGLPIMIQNASGSYTYRYDEQGLLMERSSPFGKTAAKRDGQGRIIRLDRENLSGKSLFSEEVTWRVDHKVATYHLLGNSLGLAEESRDYQYDCQGRLREEPYFLSTAPFPKRLLAGPQRASYSFDNDDPSSQNRPFFALRTAQSVNEQVGSFTSSYNSIGQVTSDLDLSDNGYHYCWNNQYDALGEIVHRSMNDLMFQEFCWDALGRLVSVSQHNERQQGYLWRTIYDGLGRRIQTSYSNVDHDATSAPLTIHYYYDPEVAFLEIGRDYFGRTWNLYGPDRSGSYGGVQGIGGLESTVTERSGAIQGVLNNFFGDAVATITDEGVYPWGNALGGYGAHLGSTVNADLVPQWRGHYLDWTGFYYMGTRYYDPKRGRFLSSQEGLFSYTYCDGDPVNGLNPDGRKECPLSLAPRFYR